MLMPGGHRQSAGRRALRPMTHDGQSAARVSGACFRWARRQARPLRWRGCNAVPREIAVEKLQQQLKRGLHRAGSRIRRAYEGISDCEEGQSRLSCGCFACSNDGFNPR
jgi:hypothetical protein